MSSTAAQKLKTKVTPGDAGGEVEFYAIERSPKVHCTMVNRLQKTLINKPPQNCARLHNEELDESESIVIRRRYSGRATGCTDR